jgi:hypothetical protein
MSKKEIDAINEAIDFISTNSDGALDFERYNKLTGTLRMIWKKAVRENAGRKEKSRLKSLQAIDKTKS